MLIHEHQARDLLRDAGLPVPEHRLATSPQEAEECARAYGQKVVIKAQVHAGGRGKAGGVALASTPEQAAEVASRILGMQIANLRVEQVLVAPAVDIEREIYVGVTLDREAGCAVLMVSAEGGVEIEEVARRSPEKIARLRLHPMYGIQRFEARRLAFSVESDPRVALRLADLCTRLAAAYRTLDASLVEINPLAVLPDKSLVAVDAKINLDDNALERHASFEALRDPRSEDEGEARARARGLSYIRLDGDVACVVNGAGLAMATMDLIGHFGGRPANFLDIGGSSNPEKVTTALEIIQMDKRVRAILFNIFGGITRCDDVAKGILMATKNDPPRVPIVVRLIGTNEAEARRLLEGTPLRIAASLDEVVQKAIEIARSGEAA